MDNQNEERRDPERPASNDEPKQAPGYHETDRVREDPDPRVEDRPDQQLPGKEVPQKDPTEGEPGRATSDSTGGQVSRPAGAGSGS